MIVARYNESLDWIHEYDIPTIIYNKGTGDFQKNTDSTVIELPNIGREGHTYLHHIIENYDNLADITIFFPGSISKTINKYGNTHKYNKSKIVMKHALEGKNVIVGSHIPNLHIRMAMFTLNNWACTDQANAKTSCADLEPASIRPFGAWYNHFFGNTPCNYFLNGGVFAISKETIRQRSLTFYIRLIQELQSHNPEAGHYLERSWATLFIPHDVTYITYNQ